MCLLLGLHRTLRWFRRCLPLLGRLEFLRGLLFLRPCQLRFLITYRNLNLEAPVLSHSYRLFLWRTSLLAALQIQLEILFQPVLGTASLSYLGLLPLDFGLPGSLRLQQGEFRFERSLGIVLFLILQDAGQRARYLAG